MINVYISHLNEECLQGVSEPVTCTSGTLREVLTQIETKHPGFVDIVLEPVGKRLRSSVLIFKDIEVDNEGRWLEGTFTTSVTSLDVPLEAQENLLIAIFNPDQAMSLLSETLMCYTELTIKSKIKFQDKSETPLRSTHE